MGAELFYLEDFLPLRMNTVFKLYYQAWLLLAVASAFGVYYWFSRPRPKSPAIIDYIAKGGTLTTGDLFRDPADRDHSLACVPLMLKRGAERTIMPGDTFSIIEGDEILLCTTPQAKRRMKTNLTNVYTVEHIATGIVPARAYAMRRLQSAAR